MNPAQRIVLGLMAALVLYVLSPGPVAAFCARHGMTDFPPAVKRLYAPIHWSLGLPGFAAFHEANIRLWFTLSGQTLPAP